MAGAAAVARFSKAVERMPSMIVVLSKKLRIACSHGAIPPDLPQETIEALAAAVGATGNGESVSVELGAQVAHRLEWADYRGARIVSERRHADRLMATLGLDACAGGHQDRIEAFGVLSEETLDPRDWRVSPVYPNKHFYVPRGVCGDAPHSCTAPRVYRVLPIEFERPTIFKTSLAYTGKPSVTGAAFLSTHIPGDVAASSRGRRLYGHVLPRRVARRVEPDAEQFTAPELLAFGLDDWTSLAESLPVLYVEEALEAYANANLRRVGASALVGLVEAFESVQPDDGNRARIVREDDANLVLVGDVHSNLHGLVDLLKAWEHHGWIDATLRLVPSVVFMGDYADRGPYGLLVFSLLFALKHRNPTRVHLIRGNHERPSFWTHYAKTGGLITELRALVDADRHAVRP